MMNLGQEVTTPRSDENSVVTNATTAGQCAPTNVRQVIGRCPLGATPCSFRIRATVDRPTRYPKFFNAPWMPCSPRIRCPSPCAPSVFGYVRADVGGRGSDCRALADRRRARDATAESCRRSRWWPRRGAGAVRAGVQWWRGAAVHGHAAAAAGRAVAPSTPGLPPAGTRSRPPVPAAASRTGRRRKTGKGSRANSTSPTLDRVLGHNGHYQLAEHLRRAVPLTATRVPATKPVSLSLFPRRSSSHNDLPVTGLGRRAASAP